MASGKNTIVIYKDWKSIFDKLTDEESGKLIKHLFAYINDENPESERLIELVFEPIKQTLKRDLKAWEQVREKRSNSGKLGGLKSGEVRKQNEANEASASITKQNEANEAVIDSVIDSDIKYIYNKFYDEQIESAKDKHLIVSYSGCVAFLFGANDLNQKLKWLSLKDQLTYEQFEKLLKKAKEKNRKIADMMLSGHNDSKKYLKDKSSVYLTLNNWLNISK